MEEKRQASQMDAALPPARHAIQNRRKDRDSRRRIKNRRNSKPEQIHIDLHLTGAKK
jgi:hypothetical protein